MGRSTRRSAARRRASVTEVRESGRRPEGHSQLNLGTTLDGKYRVDAVIGEGAFAIVYAGTHLILGARLAIKSMKASAVSPDVFAREARALFALTHPAIVRLYDAGTFGGVPYLVLELVEGKTLDRELAERRAMGRAGLTPTELVERLAPVCDALDFAHARGLIHRDIKPQNLMVMNAAAPGTPAAKVLDFGLAGALGKATGGLTPRYAAPEQWDSTLGSVGPATDVFALGLVCFEALTLAPMLEGTSVAEIAGAALDASRRRSVRSVRPELPVAVDAVLARATSPRVEERFASASALLDALRGVFSGVPERSLACSRSRPTWIYAVGAALALALVAAVATLAATRPRVAPPPPAPPTASALAAVAPTVSPDGGQPHIQCDATGGMYSSEADVCGAFRRDYSAILACMTRARVTGQAALTIPVDASGRATGASCEFITPVRSAKSAGEDLCKCVAARARTWTLPPPIANPFIPAEDRTANLSLSFLF